MSLQNIPAWACPGGFGFLHYCGRYPTRDPVAFVSTAFGGGSERKIRRVTIDPFYDTSLEFDPLLSRAQSERNDFTFR